MGQNRFKLKKISDEVLEKSWRQSVNSIILILSLSSTSSMGLALRSLLIDQSFSQKGTSSILHLSIGSFLSIFVDFSVHIL